MLVAAPGRRQGELQVWKPESSNSQHRCLSDCRRIISVHAYTATGVELAVTWLFAPALKQSSPFGLIHVSIEGNAMQMQCETFRMTEGMAKVLEEFKIPLATEASQTGDRMGEDEGRGKERKCELDDL